MWPPRQPRFLNGPRGEQAPAEPSDRCCGRRVTEKARMFESTKWRGARERKASGTDGASPRLQVSPSPRGRVLQANHEHLAHFVALEFISRPYASGKGHRWRCIAGPARPASPRPSPSPSTSRLLRRTHGGSTSPGGLQWEPQENRASAFVSAVHRKAARGCSRPRRAVRRASPTGGYTNAAPSNLGLQRTRFARR